MGTVKHSADEHELDKPGKDSFLHRKAGAIPSTIITKSLVAVYLPRSAEDNPFDLLSPVLKDNDIVLIEGNITGPGIKVEVWRKKTGAKPFILERDDIIAVITDDNLETNHPIWSLADIQGVADNICNILGIK